jgi:type IV secretion system protein VirD4
MPDRRIGMPAKPVLYLLDKFAALGHLAAIEPAMGLMAGYGVQLRPVLQDMHQLRARYGPRAGTFLSNASECQVLGVNDIETASMIARTIGRMDAHHITSSMSSPNLPWKVPDHTSSENVVARDLITPSEITRLPAEAIILVNRGQRPALERKIRYYADRSSGTSSIPLERQRPHTARNGTVATVANSDPD